MSGGSALSVAVQDRLQKLAALSYQGWRRDVRTTSYRGWLRDAHTIFADELIEETAADLMRCWPELDGGIEEARRIIAAELFLTLE